MRARDRTRRDCSRAGRTIRDRPDPVIIAAIRFWTTDAADPMPRRRLDPPHLRRQRSAKAIRVAASGPRALSAAARVLDAAALSHWSEHLAAEVERVRTTARTA